MLPLKIPKVLPRKQVPLGVRRCPAFFRTSGFQTAIAQCALAWRLYDFISTRAGCRGWFYGISNSSPWRWWKTGIWTWHGNSRVTFTKCWVGTPQFHPISRSQPCHGYAEKIYSNCKRCALVMKSQMPLLKCRRALSEDQYFSFVIWCLSPWACRQTQGIAQVGVCHVLVAELFGVPGHRVLNNYLRNEDWTQLICLSQVARISSAEMREITPLFPVAARISNKNFTRLLTRELLLPWFWWFWAMGILMAAEAPTTTKLQPSADGWHGLWSHELHPIPDERVVIYKELPNFCRVTSVKELAAGMSYHCIHTATPTAWLEMTKLTKPPTRWHTQCPAAFFRAANLKHHRPRSSGASTKSCGQHRRFGARSWFWKEYLSQLLNWQSKSSLGKSWSSCHVQSNLNVRPSEPVLSRCASAGKMAQVPTLGPPWCQLAHTRTPT